MKKKHFLLAFGSLFLSTALSFCVAGLLRLQMVYASPYTDIDVDTAYDMIMSGLYPDLVVLDVRYKYEYDGGHIYGAVWIPVTELDARIGELAGHENHEIIVYCMSGGRSATASGILESHGFTKVYNMLGGISTWQFAGYPIWIATVHDVNTTFNYDTIQAAIDAPQTLDGHTIFVEAGIYYEHVRVNKSISLIGENRSTTTIDGNLTQTVVRLSANNVKITGFTIRRGWKGIWYTASNDTVISDNTIMISRFGIALFNSYGNTISGNIVEYCQAGGYGIDVGGGGGHTIYGNTIEGIPFLQSAGAAVSDSDDNTISANKITNNIRGVWLVAGSNNTIIDNTLASNDKGIDIADAGGNTIYHNNFINNTVQAYTNGSINIWDNGYPSGGNYWSDYTGVDVKSGPNQDQPGNDGIGDTPYIIDENNRDRYPLMYAVSYHQLTVTSSPVTGIQFTINGAPKTTPYSEWLPEGSYTLEMPKIHGKYIWSHWLEDGDPNRIKTFTLSGTTWTAVYTPPPPVGGKAIPINTSIIKPELQTPWIWLSTIILPLVATIVFMKLKKKKQ